MNTFFHSIEFQFPCVLIPFVSAFFPKPGKRHFEKGRKKKNHLFLHFFFFTKTFESAKPYF